MSSEEKQVDASAKVNQAISKYKDSNLLKFDENNEVSTGKDINTKITALDTDLESLRAELGVINNSVEEGLDRLSDTDTDLTAKVSETYKRLGEIDNAYKSLLEISSRIDRDIKKLNGDVGVVAEQSAIGIKSLEESTVTQTTEFAQKNQQVVSRVNQLVETSKLTSEMMNQNIHSATDKMLQIEKSVVAQIENLSSVTKDKAQTIESTAEQNKAKILKLQSVDEAIIRRATTLEITAAELTVKGQYLDSSVEQLQISSDNLSSSILQLRERTESLEELTGKQGALIDGLQKTSANVGNVLLLLADRESKHFNIVTAAFLLLLVATVVIYFSQQNQLDLNDARYAERSEQLDKQITSLQQAQKRSSVVTSDSLAALEDEAQKTNHEMKNMKDHIQSVDGRLNQTSPLSQIGNDNIIHGAQWVSALPEQGYTVQLAYVDNKDAMYEIADRYNFHLKDSLSYFEVNEKDALKYVLLSGSYEAEQQAASAIQSMPGYIDMQKPVIREIATIQKYIADH
ncbi:MAG: hypothetical protein KAJ32_04860 [Gammaproteobacteria bacterium]|nr:hypothetical protein [Gammaproteobacteria bacterium]